MIRLGVRTTAREGMYDVTSLVAETVRREGWKDGALLVFCTHTTCGLTINEGADADVRRDLMRFFGETAPHEHGWLHAEGNSDAHIRCSLLGVSTLIPLEGGRLALGRWQSLYLYEGDGPRERTLLLSHLHP